MSPRSIDDHWVDDVAIERALGGHWPVGRELTEPERREAYRRLKLHPHRYPNGSSNALGIRGQEITRYARELEQEGTT